MDATELEISLLDLELIIEKIVANITNQKLLDVIKNFATKTLKLSKLKSKVFV